MGDVNGPLLQLDIQERVSYTSPHDPAEYSKGVVVVKAKKIKGYNEWR